MTSGVRVSTLAIKRAIVKSKGVKIEIRFFIQFKRQIVPYFGCFEFSFLSSHIRSPLHWVSIIVQEIC